MSDQFKPGDVVELKSGGPRMTVEEVGELSGTLSAWCVWFEGNKKETAVFAVTSLKASGSKTSTSFVSRA